ncbi:hypothetical protein BDL97_05G111200 [Sphagnum fallax]|nr:hypothetical protein BDL97_05G111200 [Sphagnum fallax]
MGAETNLGEKRKRSDTDFVVSKPTSGGISSSSALSSLSLPFPLPSCDSHNSQQQLPFCSSMPLSLDSHSLPDHPGSSLEDDDDAENGRHNNHEQQSDGVNGGKNGQSYGGFEGANGGDGDEEDEDDEEDDGDGNEEDGDQEDAPAHVVPRVKAELATEGGVRETGVAAQSAILGSNPAGAAVGPVEVKPSVADTIQTSGAYCSREENLKKEEDAGRLRFVCHSNDGIDQHMIWLIGLKNIFARQLPNMPKEYIVRLVMDRSHKSMMIIKNNSVVGGITYRPYLSQKFGEIAFCAITADEQVKGYGTRLMNHLKQYSRDVDGLTHFLTYADNNAVGYFTKQGFAKEIEMEKERWQGYIKDYDGGTLMECRIDPKLPYVDLPAMIRRQRQKEAGVPRRPMRIEDIPGVKEAGWVPEQAGYSRIRLVNATSDGPPTRQSLHAFMRSLLKVVAEHADAWPFKEPVDAREVPDYYDIIKDPIDLRTISRRLDSEQYFITLDMFVADMKRMFSNARTYNSPDTIYYKCTNRLDAFFMNKLQAGIQVTSRPTHA